MSTTPLVSAARNNEQIADVVIVEMQGCPRTIVHKKAKENHLKLIAVDKEKPASSQKPRMQTKRHKE